MLGSNLNRAGFIAWTVAFLCTAPGVAAQRQSAGAALFDSAPAALWESLFSRHDYFGLHDSLTAWRGPETPVVRYFRGLTARAFNRPDEAVVLLRPLLEGSSTGLSPRQRVAAARALGETYLSIYRYREAADAYRVSIRDARGLRDAERANLRSATEIAAALVNALPQRIGWRRVARLDTIANGGQRGRVTARINGVPVDQPLLVDIGADFTVIDSSTAAIHHVQLFADSVSAVTATGINTHARVGLISRLEIGPAVVANVPVIVFRDADLSSSETPSRTTGIIGSRVIHALGRFGITRDGHIAVSSPGVPPIDTTSRGRIAFDEASYKNETPVIEGDYRGQRISLLLTFADTPTRLYSSFLRRVGPTAPADTPGVRVMESGVPPRILRDLDLRVGGRTLHLDSATTITESAAAETVLHDGRLGLDALEKVDAVMFDFSGMTVGFTNLPPPPVLPSISYPDQTTPERGTAHGPKELVFIALLFALFILPKALQRFRIPGAITSLFMGLAANFTGSFPNDPTIHLLSTLGIVALFLFAGLEIDGKELRSNASALVNHAIVWAVLATVTAIAIALILDTPPRMAALFALALVTPSTGFILSSLSTFGLTRGEQRTVKSYAIGSELLALAVLFFVLQSTSFQRLILAFAAMVGVVVLIPFAFRFFASVVAPYAPRSEFAFLLMVAVVCAYTTRTLGVYYLVGAFLVGVAAQRFRADHPAMSSEKMVDALESFGSVFIPFYFFYAGTQIDHGQLTFKALGLGLLLALVLVPVRIAVVGMQRRLTLAEPFAAARRIGSALVPTLVFTLVIISILRERFGLSGALAGGLVLYTILNTLLPAFVLHGEPADFEDVEAASVTERKEA